MLIYFETFNTRNQNSVTEGIVRPFMKFMKHFCFVTMNKLQRFIILFVHILYVPKIGPGECVAINSFDGKRSDGILPAVEPPSDLCFISETNQAGKLC